MLLYTLSPTYYNLFTVSSLNFILFTFKEKQKTKKKDKNKTSGCVW